MMMPVELRTNSQLWSQLFVTAILVFTALPAKAVYTIVEDDSSPTGSRDSQPFPTLESKQSAPDHFLIPFARTYSRLGQRGRRALDTLISQLKNEDIKIVGRPDSLFNSTDDNSHMARNRAGNIRDYLTRQGISVSRITVDVDNTPNPQPNGSIYPSDIYLTRTESRNRPATSSSSNTQATVLPVSTQRKSTPVAAADTTDPEKEKTVRFINQAVVSGQMDLDVALKLIRTLMRTESVNATQQKKTPTEVVTTTTSQPAAPIRSTLFVAIPNPAPDRRESWVLSKTLTLRDNIDAWSKVSGWNPVVWKATNDYLITEATTLMGSFPDVLRQIADSTNLNICIFQHDKKIKVTDPTISCKN